MGKDATYEILNETKMNFTERPLRASTKMFMLYYRKVLQIKKSIHYIFNSRL